MAIYLITTIISSFLGVLAAQKYISKWVAGESPMNYLKAWGIALFVVAFSLLAVYGGQEGFKTIQLLQAEQFEMEK